MLFRVRIALSYLKVSVDGVTTNDKLLIRHTPQIQVSISALKHWVLCYLAQLRIHLVPVQKCIKRIQIMSGEKVNAEIF